MNDEGSEQKSQNTTHSFWWTNRQHDISKVFRNAREKERQLVTKYSKWLQSLHWNISSLILLNRHRINMNKEWTWTEHSCKSDSGNKQSWKWFKCSHRTLVTTDGAYGWWYCSIEFTREKELKTTINLHLLTRTLRMKLVQWIVFW